jgi:rhodanese-related sulfurtransferase
MVRKNKPMTQQPFSRQDMTALLVGFGLMVSVVVFFAVRNTAEDGTEEPAAIGTESASALPTIAPDEARRKLLSKTPVRIVDIRSETEYQASHIPDSVSMPAEKLSEYFPTVEGEEILVVPARDEAVSMKASGIFSQKKTDHVFIEGGIIAWEQTGGQIVSFGNPSSTTDRSKVTLIPVEDFRKAVGDRETIHAIVDVRSREAFAKSHIPEAMNIPLPELERRRTEIPPATNIALYAETDLEAFQAAVRLFDLGMFSVKTLAVGYPEWEAKGMPIEKTGDKR